MPDFDRWSSNGGDPSLNEINRADRFFEALASKQPVFSTDPAEAELAFLFSDFRDEVRDAPVTAAVSAHDAVEALRGGLAKNRGPRRGFAIVGSVAAAMLCIGGFGAGVYGAGPGDSLYGMRTAMFGQQEQTRDDQVSLASAQLQQVQQLIDQGQWEQAQDKLVQVSSAVQGVDRAENKQQLVEQWNALTYKVVEQDAAATLTPGEPLPVLPSSPLTWLPVPVVEAPTSESTVTSETATSDSSVTSDPSSSPVPPGTLITAPPDSSTPVTTPTTATSTSPTSVSTSTPPPSSTPTPAAAGPPPSRPTAVTATVPTTLPVATPSTADVPRLVPPTSTVVELSTSPRVAPSSTVASPTVSAPSSTSVASSQPSSTTTTTTTPEPPSVTPTTTVLPRFGGVS